MGSWKCGCSVYYLPIMKEITAPIHPRDGFMLARESVFFRLLSFSANGMTFDSASHFARYGALPDKQCDVVWNVCIQHKVLRKSGNAYSALQWMLEAGLVKPRDDKKAAKKARRDVQTSTPSNNTGEGKETPQNVSECKEKAFTGNGGKLAIRSNVFLTQEEYNNLKSRFSDDHLTMMLDKLNDYKTKKGVRYRSDYEAFDRWLVKWLDQTVLARDVDRNQVRSYNEQHEIEKQTESFPSWLAGKD